jgi:hypothetical protein
MRPILMILKNIFAEKIAKRWRFLTQYADSF